MSRCPVCLDPDGISTARVRAVRFDCPRCGSFYGPGDLEGQLLSLSADKRIAVSAALKQCRAFVFWESSVLQSIDALLGGAPRVPAAA